MPALQEQRSADDHQIDVIVENNPAELQGACREVLQTLTLRVALVSTSDPSLCVEAPQSYSLLHSAPFSFTIRTSGNQLLDTCRVWVVKSVQGQVDADTGDIDIKDLLLYPRQERKTCVLSTGATCVVTVGVSPIRATASMSRVPSRVETALPWGMRPGFEGVEATMIHEAAEAFPGPLEGKGPGMGLFLHTHPRGHTRSLSPVPRTVWTNTTRLVAPPLTSLPTPMAAARAATFTAFQPSPISRRSPLAPEHPRFATYTTSGLAYASVDVANAPAIRVTPIVPATTETPSLLQSFMPTMGVIKVGSNALLGPTKSEAPEAAPAVNAQDATPASPPKAFNPHGESDSDNVIDLEQGSAARREAQETDTETPPVKKPAASETETPSPGKPDAAPPIVEIATTAEATVSQTESAQEGDEEGNDEDRADSDIEEEETREGAKEEEEVSEEEEEERAEEEKEEGVSEVVEEEPVALAVTEQNRSNLKSFEPSDFVIKETIDTDRLASPSLQSQKTIIVGPHTHIIRAQHNVLCLSVEETRGEDISEAYHWRLQHKDSPDAVIPGIVNTPWDVSFKLNYSSVLRIDVEIDDQKVIASTIIDVPKMLIEDAEEFYGALEFWNQETNEPSGFMMTAHFKLLSTQLEASPVMNLARPSPCPNYRTCVFNCCGVEDGEQDKILNSYKVGIGMNDALTTYLLVNNSNSKSHGIFLNLENLDEKTVTLEVNKVVMNRMKNPEKIYLGHAKFDLNTMMKQRQTQFSGVLSIYDGEVKVHGVELKVEVTLEDEITAEIETLTDVYVKATILKAMTMTSQRTSPQLDKTFNKLRSVIDEIPAAKAKRKMATVLREVPAARHRKIMAEVVKEVPVAQTKKKMVPVLEDIAKHPFRKSMTCVVEEIQKKTTQPKTDEPTKKGLSRLPSEVSSTAPPSRVLMRSVTAPGPETKLDELVIVETQEEPFTIEERATLSKSESLLSQRTGDSAENSKAETDSKATVSSKSSKEGVKLKASTKKSKSSTSKSQNVVSKKLSSTDTTNDLASKISKAIAQDPACAGMDPAIMHKMLEIMTKNLPTAGEKSKPKSASSKLKSDAQ
eukprot:Gregarina_sp_Poly_1__3851@NODE_214_length_11311_cov_270_018855_g190_i0_p1_GENE_NODE_214_length_11311_cov_270_018855_g190_i0NODE_214_length_11311_cov_270_018855_g190_i0_p1_ORF_typecomplete_len1082_score238_91BUD22/PF09073_10/17BUD22/PF09073_10/2_7_NODE_214_length_11311_cov_270_018855_g190_i01213366